MSTPNSKNSEARRIFIALEKSGYLKKLDSYAKKLGGKIGPLIEGNQEVPYMIARRFLIALWLGLPPTRDDD
jgi:hypothetical protein